MPPHERRSRVLVARLDSLGDMLLCGPAIRAVAADAEVHVLCGPRGAPAARLLPGVAGVEVWDAPWIADPAPAMTEDSAADLRGILAAIRPDAAVILTSFHQSPLPLALMLRLAGVRGITGASVDYAGSLLDVRLRPGEDFPEEQSEVARALAIVGAAGFRLPSCDPGRLAIRLPEGASPVTTGDDGYVVVHPGAAVEARTWPAQHHRELVERLATAGVRVAVTGSDGERELTRAVSGDRAVDLGGSTPLATLARVVADADVVVAGNTGAAHLAAAVGTPVVSLFSPVVSERCWRPFGVPTVVFGAEDAACAGSRARSCPVPGHPCLASVPPAAVAQAVLALRPARPGSRTTGSHPGGAGAGSTTEAVPA
ncbi:glycosyltransferase family 9 protein [Agromyces indicus]|uniref:Glycosyltransferase family 9 protein n=1 Tax=Agromyces indicus TaxID=758919 RepID=A0ABU1FL45_9MICO|nr:glycosyltransferase family 9 protein [Agromyces indicus]MDR5692141.1 glycosyltransferase family 9 protein [Agromyces indicus]